jgi:NADH:ubiquinone oxidoreductase subunit 4 (subunit M)
MIVGIWGSRDRKILAILLFFIHFAWICYNAFIYLIYLLSSRDYYEVLLTFSFSELEQKFLFFSFLSFASKVPMVPVHLWLPEAHVSPTGGSVILAGVLLKLGTYGFIRFSLPLFPKASFFFAPLVYTIAAVGIIYTSFTAIRQTDFKIIASSIAHMNLVILGIFSFNTVGLEGAIVQSLSHGFVASALFVIIGVVYDRYRTRIVKYYGGLATVMPIYITIFLFLPWLTLVSLVRVVLWGVFNFSGLIQGEYNYNLLGATSVVIGELIPLVI